MRLNLLLKKNKMSGQKDLAILLQGMEPVINKGEFVFCQIPNDAIIPDLSKLLFFFREAEAITLVLEKSIADNLSLDYSQLFSWITLNVHSSLEAVGLTAAFSNALTKENISCNVVAAYFHDHIFVPKINEEKAMKTLLNLTK